MLSIIFYGGIIVSLIVVWTEYKCAVSNRKFYQTTQSILWMKIYKWRYLVAFLLVPILMFGYPVSVDNESYQVIGFPLMGAVFDSTGRDFISALTGIFLLIDAVIFYFFIHVLLCIAQRWTNNKKEK